MKLSSVKARLAEKQDLIVDVMRNPSNLSEWVIWIRKQSGKSHLVVNDDDSIIRSEDANIILSLLKDMGVKSVHFLL